jgi:hypothetical protein
MQSLYSLQDANSRQHWLAPPASSAISGVPPQIIHRIVILITAFLLAQMSE